jgi:hypothetical protein
MIIIIGRLQPSPAILKLPWINRNPQNKQHVFVQILKRAVSPAVIDSLRFLSLLA